MAMLTCVIQTQAVATNKVPALWGELPCQQCVLVQF